VRAQNFQPLLDGTATTSGSLPDNPDQPVIAAGGVVNAASFRPNAALAPGSYVSIFGSRLAREMSIAPSLPLPAQLAGTTATIAGRALPLHFSSDGQVNAILPYGIAENTTHQLIVRRATTLSTPEPVVIATSGPALFSVDGSGSGQGHIYGVTEHGTLALADNARPARAGEVVVMYATGLGPVSPTPVAGEAAPSSPLATVANPVVVTIQERPARVLFAGLAPGFAGLYQLNIETPEGVRPEASALVVVRVGEQSSPPVTMAVR